MSIISIHAQSTQGVNVSLNVRQYSRYITRLLYHVAPQRTPHLSCNLGRVRQILEALFACATSMHDRAVGEVFTPGLRRIAEYLPKAEENQSDEWALAVVRSGLAELRRFQKQTGLVLYEVNSPDWRAVAFSEGDRPKTEFFDFVTPTIIARIVMDQRTADGERNIKKKPTPEEMKRRHDFGVEWVFDQLLKNIPEVEAEPQPKPVPPLIDIMTRGREKAVKTHERTLLEIEESERRLAYLRDAIRDAQNLYFSELKQSGHTATIMNGSTARRIHSGVIHDEISGKLSDAPSPPPCAAPVAGPKSETHSEGTNGVAQVRKSYPVRPTNPLTNQSFNFEKNGKNEILDNSDLRHNATPPAAHLGELLAAAKDSGTDPLQAAGYSLIPLFPADVSGKCTCREGDRCGSSGKHPMTANGVKDAGVDVPVNCATSNVGLATGKINGVIVLDVDPRNGGEESLQRLSNAALIPATVTIATSGGGLHFYFEYPDKPIRGNRTLPGYPGIDIKSDGGYVVCPPSRTGEAYRVAGRPRPPAPLEPELLKLLLTEPAVTRRIPGAGAAIGAFSPAAQGHSAPALKEGEGRNNWLFRALIAYRARGADAVEVRMEAERINAAFADPLPLSEFEATVKSAINRPATLPGYEVVKS